MRNNVDLSLLPSPDVIEALDYESIFTSMIADLRARSPEFSALVESDPAYKILEVAAYRELLIRQRVNDAARSVMLAYSKGSDLDNIAANFGVERILISAGDPKAVPPIPAIYETDERLRERVPLSLESYSTAGPIGAYRYHARTASTDVRDVSISSPKPGEVLVTVLSTAGDGTASDELIALVDSQLNDEEIRPLTDTVIVQSAEIISYNIEAELTFYSGPSKAVVLENAIKSVTDYAQKQRKLGYDITISALHAALHVEGVQNVEIKSPVTDAVISDTQSAHAIDISVTAGGVDE